MTEAEVSTLAEIFDRVIRQNLGPLETKIAVLEARPLAPTLEDLRPLVEAETVKAWAARPVAPTLDELRGVVEVETIKHLAARPPARDGRDGLSLTGALVDRAGHLVLTVSDGRTLDVGPILGAPGPAGNDGRPGRDAVLKGGLVLKRIDPRRFEFLWEDGSPVAVVDADGQPVPGPIAFPVPIYKQVWTDAAPYEEADLVTHDGSVWLAKRATRSRPGDGAPDWQLVVKRGAQGARGKAGEQGPPGRDLTSMTLEGVKYR